MGNQALYSNTTGSFNIGIGYEAGYYLTTGSSNIEIGNRGVAADNGIIRIGQPGVQTQTYIAGIATAQITGAAVYVAANGHLGVLASSERYKTAIAPIGSSTEKLDQLRPVSFHLKNDPNGAVQYGLIAEEVDKVYPELVIRDETGKIQGVRYDELAPILLREMQQQATEIRRLNEESAALKAKTGKIDELIRQVAELSNRQQELHAAHRVAHANTSLLAQR
jgi:Chaperone of endosialidase